MFHVFMSSPLRVQRRDAPHDLGGDLDRVGGDDGVVGAGPHVDPMQDDDPKGDRQGVKFQKH